MTSLGVRASDGGSIHRPPNEERYCTLSHLDTEEQILAAAKRTVSQLVSREQARAAVERTGLTGEQRDAVVMMLAAAAATTVLVAPAGAGKSHTMAEFARLWTTLTGRRVIGLTTSTNAARVLQHEGLAESYNIAEFLGKTEGSDELRRPVPLHQDDVLVLDEASQLSTADLAMIGEAARQAAARITATGDTAQLGAVEAGGMFGLLSGETANARYEEWSARTASIRETAGKAKAELQRRGQQPTTGGTPGPQSTAAWWREFQADVDAMDRAIEREHQAAVHDGQPWPPDRKPEAGHQEPDAIAPGSEPQLAYSQPGIPEARTDPEPEASRLETSGLEAAGPCPADDGRAARLDELQACADEAARRIDAQRAELDARSEHTARLEREAQAWPEADRQPETPYEMEMEL